MTDIEKAKFTAAVAGLASFYGVELSHMALGIYWDTLREHDLKPLQEAMRCHVKDPEHGRWMPRPADIIRHLPGRTPIMGADAAWEVAMISRLWDEDATHALVLARAWRRTRSAFSFTHWPTISVSSCKALICPRR